MRWEACNLEGRGSGMYGMASWAYRTNPDVDVRTLERQVAKLGDNVDIEALKAARVREGITPADVLRSLEGVPSPENLVRLLVTNENGYQRVFDAYRAHVPIYASAPGSHSWITYEVSILGPGSASGHGSGSLFIAKGVEGHHPESVQLHYGKDKVYVVSVVVVPAGWQLKRKADTRKPDEKPIRLGTRRSRAIFEQIVATGGYRYDGREVSHEGPSIEYARRPDGLEAHAIKMGIKSMRPWIRSATDQLAGVPGIKYYISYHSNHSVDFVSPAEGDDSQNKPAGFHPPTAVSQARQYATEHLAPGEVYEPETVPWEPEEYVPAAFAPPPPPLVYAEPAGLPRKCARCKAALGPGSRSPRSQSYCAACLPGERPLAPVMVPLYAPETVPWEPEEYVTAGMAPPAPPLYMPEGPEVYGPELPGIGRADYEERRQRRMESLERQAGRARSEAASQFRRADLREEASGIPFGQPILVGHHSEGRHRRALARADAAMRRSIEAAEHAQAAEAQLARMERQEERGTAPISSDDPEALVRLQEKLDGLVAQRDRMKDVNLIVRRAAKATVGIAAKDVREGEAARQVLAASIPLGLTPGEAESLARSYRLQSYHGVGYPGYAITNLGAEIRRVQDRVEGMRREALSRAEAVATGQVEPQAFDGFELIENLGSNRVQLVFGGKPGPKTRALLKSNGFRWSPTEGAWQRQLNDAGRRAAAQAAGRIVAAEHGGYLQNPWG